MLVAVPLLNPGPSRIKFSCPHPRCKSTMGGPFTGSASNVMRHFHYHPTHAGEGVKVVLFSVCQINPLAGQRFLYISDEYGAVGQEAIFKNFYDLSLHPSIPAAPAPAEPAQDGKGSRKRAQPAIAEEPGSLQTSEDVRRDDERWAEQERLNARLLDYMQNGQHLMQRSTSESSMGSSAEIDALLTFKGALQGFKQMVEDSMQALDDKLAKKLFSRR